MDKWRLGEKPDKKVKYVVVKKLKNKKTVTSVLSALFVIIVAAYAWPHQTIAPLKKPRPVSQTPSKAIQTSAFNKERYSTETAPSLWVVVNKGRQLPADYVPANLVTPGIPLRLSPGVNEMHLRADAASALETMFAAAKAQNLNLMLASGYRSYSDQVAVYNSYVAQSGVAKADTFSARPGHSEHQTGLAADIEPQSRACEVEQCFENTQEGRWLAANSYKYGFIIRYQKTTENLTGYEYEPWHIRYVGLDLAQQLYEKNQTMEQFFDLPSYTNYPADPLHLKDE